MENIKKKELIEKLYSIDSSIDFNRVFEYLNNSLAIEDYEYCVSFLHQFINNQELFHNIAILFLNTTLLINTNLDDISKKQVGILGLLGGVLQKEDEKKTSKKYINTTDYLIIIRNIASLSKNQRLSFNFLKTLSIYIIFIHKSNINPNEINNFINLYSSSDLNFIDNFLFELFYKVFKLREEISLEEETLENFLKLLTENKLTNKLFLLNFESILFLSSKKRLDLLGIFSNLCLKTTDLNHTNAFFKAMLDHLNSNVFTYQEFVTFFNKLNLDETSANNIIFLILSGEVLLEKNKIQIEDIVLILNNLDKKLPAESLILYTNLLLNLINLSYEPTYNINLIKETIIFLDRTTDINFLIKIITILAYLNTEFRVDFKDSLSFLSSLNSEKLNNLVTIFCFSIVHSKQDFITAEELSRVKNSLFNPKNEGLIAKISNDFETLYSANQKFQLPDLSAKVKKVLINLMNNE